MTRTQRIQRKEITPGVIGMGSVRLPLAVDFTRVMPDEYAQPALKNWDVPT